jgi:predicted TIM-barrel fold metal-dependent hydrolase
MDTPWGQLPVADAHVHFFSHRFFSLLAAQKGAPVEALEPLLGWTLPERDPVRLAETWTNELDRRGVARAALIASLPSDRDSVIAAVARFPQRFVGCMMADPTAPDAVEQTRAALATGRIRVVCFFPSMQRYSMHDARVNALLDLVSATPGAIAFVHCGVLSVGVRHKLGLASVFDMRFANPIDLHAVALRYPQTRFIVPHFGAGYFREALMLCDLAPNVLLDTSSSNQWMRYDESHSDLRAVFRRALDVVGPNRLIFGTDSSFFPRGWNAAVFEAQAKALYETGASAEVARMIFHDNFERLFT